MKDLRFEFDIAGHKVELTRVAPRTRASHFQKDAAGKPKESPAEQRLYEIRIDGDFVGRASKPFGIGKTAYSIEKITGIYTADAGSPVVFSADHTPVADRLFDFEKIALKAVELRSKTQRKLRVLFTNDELSAFRVDAAAVHKKKVEEAARELEDRRAARIVERAEQDRHFEEMIGGLRSIDDRFGQDMNNYELNALRAVLERYEREKATMLHNRIVFED